MFICFNWLLCCHQFCHVKLTHSQFLLLNRIVVYTTKDKIHSSSETINKIINSKARTKIQEIMQAIISNIRIRAPAIKVTTTTIGTIAAIIVYKADGLSLVRAEYSFLNEIHLFCFKCSLDSFAFGSDWFQFKCKMYLLLIY